MKYFLGHPDCKVILEENTECDDKDDVITRTVGMVETEKEGGNGW